MFYDILKAECNAIGETPNSVCLKLGFSNSTATYWKKSGKPPKREAVEKIAAYLNCSVDHLLGREEKSDVKKAEDLTKVLADHQEKLASLRNEMQSIVDLYTETVTITQKNSTSQKRDAVHKLIDKLPDDKLDRFRIYLESLLKE